MEQDISQEGVIRAAQAQSKRRQPTAGERVFDRGVYTGIGLGVNEVGSLILTDQFVHGIGKEWYHKAGAWVANTLKYKDTSYISHGAKKMVSPHERGENLLLWFSLTLVGTALVWPMKYLEDHKAAIVKKLNHGIDKLSGRSPNAARDAEVEEAIACEPKQTWPSLIIGRLISIATSMSLAFSLGRGRTEIASDYTEKWSRSAVGKVNEWTGGGEQSTLGRIMKTDRFKSYARLLAPETIGCTATSIVLEITSKFFARRKPVIKDPALCLSAHSQENCDAATRLFADGVGKKPATYTAKIAQETQPGPGLQA